MVWTAISLLLTDVTDEVQYYEVLKQLAEAVDKELFLIHDSLCIYYGILSLIIQTK